MNPIVIIDKISELDLGWQVGKIITTEVADIAGEKYHTVSLKILRKTTRQEYIERANAIASVTGAKTLFEPDLEEYNYYEVLMD